MIQQIEFSLRPFPRGFHLITSEVLRQLPTRTAKDRNTKSFRQTHKLWIVT